MGEGVDFTPWVQTDAQTLTLGLLVLGGLWLLRVAFPRESKRLDWAWTRPRNLTSRNATETPRTLGVMLSFLVSVVGVSCGLSLLWPQHEWAETMMWSFGWLGMSAAMQWIGVRALLGVGEQGSAWIEIQRHNHTWMSVTLGVWGVLAALSPHLQHSGWVPTCTWMVFGLAMVYGSWRSSQLWSSRHPHRVLGILYLCTLEWGWSFFWLAWSWDSALRGH